MLSLRNLLFGKGNVGKVVIDDKPYILPDLLECEVEKIIFRSEISKLKNVINFSSLF
jgi:hypothetical protein